MLLQGPYIIVKALSNVISWVSLENYYLCISEPVVDTRNNNFTTLGSQFKQATGDISGYEEIYRRL